MRIDETPDWDMTPHDPVEGSEPAPDQEQLPKRSRWRWWKRGIYASLGLFLALFLWLAVTAPLSRSLQPIAAPSITLLSAEGDPIAKRGAEIAAPVKISELPDHVPAAFISIEDRRFRQHFGISIRGIGRAAWRNLGAGGVQEGGSTITQQLAKVSFLTPDRTLGRKAQEVLIAFWLEGWLTKDEILERYLSNVYFGDNVYGLRAASRHYFSIEPEKLSTAQAAMLAGMVKAPSRLAPTKNLKGARERAGVVLGTMVRDGVLTRREADALRPARVRLTASRKLPTGTYFADWVMPEARASGEEGYGEREVQTTLETRLQRLAWRAVNRSGVGAAQVALVAMRPDGRVVAMIGGKSYEKSPFNRATQARRQPGSTFKLFVYLAALRAGMQPDSIVDDSPLTIGDWTPRNSANRYRGAITLRQAFAASSNVAAVRIAEQIGRDKVIQAARDLGVRSPLGNDPSLALGTSGTTLLEMTAAYAAVAQGSYPVRPRGVDTGPEPWWRRAWQSVAGTTSDGAFPELNELLFAAVNEGTGRAAALQEPTFGKTGTSQDNRDAIFIGYTEDLVVGVWIGKDDNSPLGGVAGGGLPARIWRDFMASAVNSTPKRAAPTAAPVEEEPIELNATLSLPIEGADIELGVSVGENGFSVSADPGPGDEPAPAPRENPAPPPSAPREEEGPQA
jgi:penicillin-binding protein 1A